MIEERRKDFMRTAPAFLLPRGLFASDDSKDDPAYSLVPAGGGQSSELPALKPEILTSAEAEDRRRIQNFQAQNPATGIAALGAIVENAVMLNVEPDRLERSRVPDASIKNVWLRFATSAYCVYHAVYNFPYGEQAASALPHIMLISPNNDVADMESVLRLILAHHPGSALDPHFKAELSKKSVQDRLASDPAFQLRMRVNLTQRPTQAAIGTSLREFWDRNFFDVQIARLFLKDVPIDSAASRQAISDLGELLPPSRSWEGERLEAYMQRVAQLKPGADVEFD